MITTSTKQFEKNWKVSGLVPDIKDDRDYILTSADFKVGDGPADSYDLRTFAREIENQGAVGSCVGNATASCLELYALSKLDLHKDFSRLFIYWNARDLGNITGDEGAYLRDGLKSCNTLGVCEESFWPYIESDVNEYPSNAAYDEARKNRNITYERITNTDIAAFKNAIFNGMSVVIGMALSSSFYSITGPLADQNYVGILEDADFIGGHAMNVVGYDDNLNGGSFIVENSWGESWGDLGYFALPYDVWINDAYDAWTCTNLKIDMLNTDDDYVPGPSIPSFTDISDIYEKVDEIIQEASVFFTSRSKFNKRAPELRAKKLKGLS